MFSLKKLVQDAEHVVGVGSKPQPASTAKPKQQIGFNSINNNVQQPAFTNQPAAPKITPNQNDLSAKLSHFVGGVISPVTNTTGLIGNDAKLVAARLTGNQTARANADAGAAKNIQNLTDTARNFTTRPTVSLAASLIPKQITVKPTSLVGRALLGTTPVQNIEKGVATNYNAHPNLNPAERVGLAGAYGAGQLVQDVPIVGSELKLASKGAEAAKVGNATKSVDSLAKNTHPIVAAFDKHYTPASTATPQEKFAADYIRNNPEKAMADYNARVTQKFGSPRIVAGDEAKHIIPGFNSTKSVAYHEPASPLAKVKAEHLLADESTKHLPVLQMSGGTGAGKTSSLLKAYNPEDYAATVDTNSNVLGSARNKIDKSLATGRPVIIAHVHRDLIDAFRNGVVPRTAKEGRLVTAKTHVDTNMGANRVFHQLQEHYKDNPNVLFKAFENKTGESPTRLDNAPKLSYNREEALNQLKKEVEDAHQQGKITSAERKAYLEESNARSSSRKNSGSNDKGNERAVSSKESEPQRSIEEQKPRQVSAALNTGQFPIIGASLSRVKSGIGKAVPEIKDSQKSPKTTQSVDDVNVAKTSQKPTPKNSQISKLPTGTERISSDKSLVSSLDASIPQERGFTKSVKQSSSYTKPLKKAIDQTSQYKVATDKEAIAQAAKFSKQPLNLAHSSIIKKLQSNARLSKQDIVNGGTIMQHLDSAGRTAEAQNLHDLLATHLTEAGQKSQAAKLLLRRSPDGIYHKAVSDIRKAGKEVTPDIDKQLQDHREAIRNTAPDSPERNVEIQKLRQFVSKNLPVSATDNAFAFWRAGLLTGPRTVGKILTSHGIHAPLEKLKDVPASLIDRAVSKVTGNRSLVLTTKGKAGFEEGAKAGFGKQGYFRTGIDVQPGNNSVEFHNNANYGQSVPGKIAQAYVDGIGRLHGSIYKPFFGYGHLNSLYSLAKAESKNAGLKGAEAETFEQNFVKDPPTWAQDIAQKDAENLTFQQETALGKFASAIQKHGGVVGKVIAPFTRIPSAIATDLFNYSPVGAIKTIADGIKAAKSSEGWSIADQRAFSQGLGRSIVGTAAVVPGYMLYQKGLMTLDYPTDPKEQKLWQLEGKTADSVKIDGKWRALGSLGPLGSVLSIGGYLADSQQKGESASQSAINALAGGLKTIESQPYVSGISGATNTLQDPGRYLTSLEKQYAGSVIPTGIAQIASSFDPLQRQANNAGDTLKSKIPFLRESLAPKTNAFGQNVVSGETGPGALIDPFYSSKSLSQTPLTNELQRLQDVGQGELPSTVPANNTFDGVKTKLSKPQAQTLGSNVGKTVEDLWNQTIASSAYSSLPDDQKHQMLANILSDTTSAIKEKYAADNLLGQYSDNYGGKAKPLSQKQQNILDGSFSPADYLPKEAKTPAYTIKNGVRVSSTKTKSTKSSSSKASSSKFSISGQDSIFKAGQTSQTALRNIVKKPKFTAAKKTAKVALAKKTYSPKKTAIKLKKAVA